MLIALDYDDTFTRDPDGWLEFVKLMKARGHQFVGATMRYPGEASGMDERYESVCQKLYFTGRKAKRSYLADVGVFPHVWVDDTPEWISTNAAQESE